MQSKLKSLPNRINLVCKVREGNGTPLQYSCLENPMDGGACKAAVHGVAKSRTRLKRLSSSSVEYNLASQSQESQAEPSHFLIFSFCADLRNSKIGESL